MTSKPSAKKTAASKPASVTLTPYLIRRHRARVAEWMQANGVDPDVVSASHPIRVEDGVIFYRAFDLDVDARLTHDEATGDAATVERTARCTRPAPRLVEAPVDRP